MDIDKLEQIFSVKYASLLVEGDRVATYENWISYCDRHKILLLDPEWMVDTLNEGLKGRVCIHTPEKDHEASPWLLVPRKFAERSLVLGFLP